MGGSEGGVFLLEQPPEKGSLSLKHALFQRQLWKPMLPLEVLSAQVNTVCLSLSSACLLPAFLYTTFEMASGRVMRAYPKTSYSMGGVKVESLEEGHEGETELVLLSQIIRVAAQEGQVQ